MTPLPLRVAPHPNEAWHGYLTRTAAQYDATVARLADHIRLRRDGRWPGYHGVLLDAQTASATAEELNLEATQVLRMQLASLDQSAFDLTGLDIPQRHQMAATQRVTNQGWVFLAGGRYCATCLRTDGVWRLEWRIPWITTCTLHGCWLEHRCPRCEGVIGRYNGLNATAPSRAATRIGSRFCDLPLGHGTCGADLAEGDMRPCPPEATESTRNFRTTIGSQVGVVAGKQQSSLKTLQAWQAAIGISISLGRSRTTTALRNHRWTSPPRDALEVHQLVMDVAPVVKAESVDQAADELLEWCRTAGIPSPHRDTFARATRPASALTPVTTSALARAGRVHIRLARQRVHDQQTLPLLPWTPHDVPQLAWPCTLPPKWRTSTRPDQLILRAVLAMLLVRMHSGTTWADSGATLGIPPDKARNWTRYCFSARFHHLKDDLLNAARSAADVLPHQPTRAAWHRRPDVTDEFGTCSLTRAQSPQCRSDDPAATWCPCTSETLP